MDAVIVLGNGVNPDGSLGESQKAQIQKAVDLLHDGQVDHIITCGAFGYKADMAPELTEADAYKSYAISIGAPDSLVFTETRSKETVGNLLFAKTNIMIPHKWLSFIVIPGHNHSDERVEYITNKVFGPQYSWKLLRSSKNTSPENTERERRSMELTTRFNDPVEAGDHEQIWSILFENHPAYNPNSKLRLEDLKRDLSPLN